VFAAPQRPEAVTGIPHPNQGVQTNL
jgi:hypothetical protein